MKLWCRLGLLAITLLMSSGAALDCGWFATAGVGAFLGLVGLVMWLFTKPEQWVEEE